MDRACKPVHIVISRGNADKSLSLGFFIVLLVFCNKFGDVSLSAVGEERLLAAEKIVVARGSEVEQEVHVESALNGLVGLAPFGDHSSLGKFPVEKFTYILPELYCALAVFIVLDQ